jgi:hypothetical protein
MATNVKRHALSVIVVGTKANPPRYVVGLMLSYPEGKGFAYRQTFGPVERMFPWRHRPEPSFPRDVTESRQQIHNVRNGNVAKGRTVPIQSRSAHSFHHLKIMAVKAAAESTNRSAARLGPWWARPPKKWAASAQVHPHE